MFNMNTNCDVYISSSNITDCKLLAEYLKTLNIMANVSENTSIICSNKNYTIEKGCKISYTCNVNTMKEKLWIPIQKKYDLTCAYVDISSKFNGCIYDLYRKSNCPSNIT